MQIWWLDLMTEEEVAKEMISFAQTSRDDVVSTEGKPPHPILHMSLPLPGGIFLVSYTTANRKH